MDYDKAIEKAKELCILWSIDKKANEQYTFDLETLLDFIDEVKNISVDGFINHLEAEGVFKEDKDVI